MQRTDVIALMKQWEKAAKERQPVTIVFSHIQDALECCLSELGKGKKDDPFKNFHDTLIRQFAITLRNLNEHLMSIYAFKQFYQKCVALELETGERIHKADTLHWIARYYLQNGDVENAFLYAILCFLDDVISEVRKTTDLNGRILISDTMLVPICQMLQLYFHIPKVNLSILRENARKILEEDLTIINPEHLISKMRESGYQIPRYNDYKYYHPSYASLKRQYETIKETKDHREWEKFAAFLFSSVEGFEPILNVRPGYSSYQFDVVIRNITPHDFSIQWLGEYFAIECKYYEQDPVNVEDLDHFASKLKYHDFKCGIVFTRTPISGWKTTGGEAAGQLVQTKLFNRHGLIVFDLTEEDLKLILEGKNLIEVLIEKYEKVRLDL
ncbi:MAG: restriction endonuclease [Desulfobacterales bacterium]|nr:restriction endonuclease [Desulfobacterales bacterium]